MSSRHEGKFCKVFQVDLKDQVYNRSKYQKDTKQVSWFLSERESRLWQETAIGARHTYLVEGITIDNWCNQSRRTYRATYMV